MESSGVEVGEVVVVGLMKRMVLGTGGGRMADNPPTVRQHLVGWKLGTVVRQGTSII